MKRQGLGLKLALIIALSTLMMLVVLLSLYAAIYARGINEQTIQYASEELENIKVLLDDYLNDLVRSAETVAAQSDIINFVASEDAPSRFILTNTIKSQLASYVYFKQGVMQMYLRSTSGTRIASSAINAGVSVSDVFQIYRNIQSKYDLSTPFKRSYMTDVFTTAQGKACFGIIVPVHQPIAAPKDSDYLGCLVILCGTDGLASSIPVSTRDKLLITQGDTIIYSGSAQLASTWLRDGSLHHAKTATHEGMYQVLTDTLSTCPWTVHILAVSDNIEEKLQEVKRFCIIVGVMLIIIQFSILILSYRAFVHPIVDTVSQIKQIKSLRERIVPPKNTGAELDTLIMEMNNLMERTEQLNTVILRTERKHYQEKIIFLQAQINPHFLYNNLQCIRGMAATGNAAGIREMASCIAAIYRYGCRDGAMATLRDELDCIQRYTRIIDLRYGPSFDVQIESDEDSLTCLLPRMALQPLVENCIVHGFHMANKQDGHILIRARKNLDTLYIHVHDNGCGIDSETLREINASRIANADNIKHLGIANIRTRIELLFGTNSSLIIHSDSCGTSANLEIHQSGVKHMISDDLSAFN